MRSIRAVAAYCSILGVSAQEAGGWPSPLGRLDTQGGSSTVGVASANSTEAARRYGWDFREDMPFAGQRCTPSPLWATDVDPTKYEIGCTEIEVRGSTRESTKALRGRPSQLNQNGAPRMSGTTIPCVFLRPVVQVLEEDNYLFHPRSGRSGSKRAEHAVVRLL